MKGARYDRQDLDRYYADGLRKGKKQGKKDMLALFRIYLTQQEGRVERES